MSNDPIGAIWAAIDAPNGLLHTLGSKFGRFFTVIGSAAAVSTFMMYAGFMSGALASTPGAGASASASNYAIIWSGAASGVISLFGSLLALKITGDRQRKLDKRAEEFELEKIEITNENERKRIDYEVKAKEAAERQRKELELQFERARSDLEKARLSHLAALKSRLLATEARFRTRERVVATQWTRIFDKVDQLKPLVQSAYSAFETLLSKATDDNDVVIGCVSKCVQSLDRVAEILPTLEGTLREKDIRALKLLHKWFLEVLLDVSRTEEERREQTRRTTTNKHLADLKRSRRVFERKVRVVLQPTRFPVRDLPTPNPTPNSTSNNTVS